MADALLALFYVQQALGLAQVLRRASRWSQEQGYFVRKCGWRLKPPLRSLRLCGEKITPFGMGFRTIAYLNSGDLGNVRAVFSNCYYVFYFLVVQKK